MKKADNRRSNSLLLPHVPRPSHQRIPVLPPLSHHRRNLAPALEEQDSAPSLWGCAATNAGALATITTNAHPLILMQGLTRPVLTVPVKPTLQHWMTLQRELLLMVQPFRYK